MTTRGNVSRALRIVCMTAISAILLIAVALPAESADATATRTSSGLEIFGDSRTQTNVLHALAYLDRNSPEDHANVIFWLTEIRPTSTYTRVNNYGVCYLNSADYDANYVWLACVLIHEAQHVADDNTYFLTTDYSAEESETRALTVQADFLATENGWTAAEESAWIDGWIAKRYWEIIPEKYH